MNLENRLQQMVTLLEERRLRYALAGGIAASIYRLEPRTTIDVDFFLVTPNGTAQLAVELVRAVGLKEQVARQAEFDGGPPFAIKRKSWPEVAVLGRVKNFFKAQVRVKRGAP